MRKLLPACLFVLLPLSLTLSSCGRPRANREPGEPYPWKHGVIATVFWVGEGASSDNGHISNAPSAWQDDWVKHFGGVDEPKARRGWLPGKFEPLENPFYFALPYNDLAKGGAHKAEIWDRVPWLRERRAEGLPKRVSAMKNRWIEVRHGDRQCFAQWEDTGPYGENDVEYVFGDQPPANRRGLGAGIDLSPALRDCLGVRSGRAVSWRFREDSDVPAGPWRERVTGSQIDW